MKKLKHLSLASWKPVLINGLFFCLVLSACSTSNDGKSGKPVPFMPADMQNIGRDNSVRSVSAGEALSRGIAAVTPRAPPCKTFTMNSTVSISAVIPKRLSSRMPSG